MNTLRRIVPIAMVAVVVALDAYADPERSEREFSALYVFGDSLSDPGNTWALLDRRLAAKPVSDSTYLLPVTRDQCAPFANMFFLAVGLQ